MNSESLQEAFPAIYQDFFSKCSIAVSASGSFWFAGEYAVLEGGLAILQKVPMRFYIGISPSEKPGVTDLGGYEFVHSKKEFKKVDFHYWWQITKEAFNDFLENELKKTLPDGYPPGINITYLSEIPTSSGINASAALSATMACAFLTYTGEITPEIYNSWKGKKVSELSKDNLFDRAFRLAWKIEAILHGGASSGATVLAAFVNSNYPIIYFSEKRSGRKDASGKTRFPAYDPKTISIFDKIEFRCFGLDELEPDITGEWPIDFGLIYSGDFIRTPMVIKSMPDFEGHLERVRALIKEKIGSIIKKMPSHIVLTDIIKSPQEIRNSYMRSINATAARVFYNLIWTFRAGGSDARFAKLADTINIYQDSLRTFNISSPRLDFICDSIVHEGEKRNEKIGCKLSGSGKKGDILFVAPCNSFREDIWTIISGLRDETREDISLDYASWLDGIGDKNVSLEQDLKTNVLSPLISKGTVEIERLDSGGKISHEIYTLDKFEREKNSFGLLLDLPNGDIYIKGRKLTSKDVKTARETVSVLDILIKSIRKAVPNTSFSHSSYASDRGEFQGKIISPLNKILEKETGEKLPVSISGSIDVFSVKLEAGANICLIKRRF